VADWGQAGEASIPPRFALLVGVEQYPKLAAHEQLAGSVNDTVLMRQVLWERYGFPESNIVTLCNEAATGDAIRREFRGMLERLRSLPPDAGTAQIVFHFSGHGSQVADQPVGDPDCDELDGLDETLVPFDATKQGGPEDIRDDELYSFVDQLCADGRARIWLILDCCHSGTGARGATRFRSLQRGTALPLEARSNEIRRVNAKRLPAGAMLLSACRSSEKEPEYQEGNQSYGLLTRFVTQALNQEQAVSRLSYDALRESLVVQYRQAGISQAPTPQLEGSSRGIVLGADSTFDRQPVWRVQADPRDRSIATLSAGLLHGITVGSLFELYERPDQISDRFRSDRFQVDEPATDGRSSRPWLKVERADGATSTMKIIGWRGEEEVSATLPIGLKEGFALERHHEHGDFSLRVRVVRAADENEDSPAFDSDNQSIPAAIRETLIRGRRDDSESRWLEWVSGDRSCDVLLRIADPFVAVFPTTGNNVATPTELVSRGSFPTSLRGGWGPIDLRANDAAHKLLEMLRQINRVRNLQRIAAISPEPGPNQPQIKLELVQIEVDAQSNISADRAWPISHDENGHPTLVMQDEALYTVRVTNLAPAASAQTVYVTVLQVDANMGIDVLLPYQEGATEEQVIPAGGSRLSGPFQCNSPGQPPIHGIRNAIFFATLSPNDFSIFASSSLPVTRGSIAATNSSLNDLLVEQTYFRTRGGTTKLSSRKPIETTWSASTIQWKVQP